MEHSGTDPTEIILALRQTTTDLQAQVSHLESRCRAAGMCMTCLYQFPELHGCTDCLNTGWAFGSPIGFKPDAP